MNRLVELLSIYTFADVLPFKLSDAITLDLSVNNPELYKITELNTSSIGQYVDKKIKEAGKEVAIGGYAEDRLVYKRSRHFGEGENARSIHLGIDIWCDAGTPVLAPMDGKVHSFNNNNNFADYGPTIILEHKIEDLIFFTLYGHLSLDSLKKSRVGSLVDKGEKFAELGTENENGSWPPHLHLQVITDMEGRSGDFPGVASQKDKDYFLKLCPNPRMILNV